MKRKLLENLKEWKDKQGRKPLIIQGARQVGKTYLLKQFGETYYENTVYINFDRSEPDIERLFSGSIEPSRIVDFLAIKYSTVIKPGKTLIILDEIQELPRALASLKYFYEDAPEYHVVAAGSLLGVALHRGTSFPVGKVEFLHLDPLSFEEFCWAQGLEEKMQYVRNNLSEGELFGQDFSDAFDKYIAIGGMPEAVTEWHQSKDIKKVERVLRAILDGYRNDFSKYADTTQAERINQVWQSIPSQFAKESKKFVYGAVKSGARAREYELAITWLEDAGLVHKIHSVARGDKLPLSAYSDISAFKLYLLDIGLLRVMAHLSPADILSHLFSQFGGLFAEQYVLQQISRYDPYYWTSGAQSEVDFVVQYDSKIIPIEVKSGNNVKAKSLRVYRDRYSPSFAVRFSMKPLKMDDGLLNVPLYYSWLLEELLANEEIAEFA